MTVEIRTTSVKPLRNTFAHLERRFGDKPATRYQEATYDLQPEVNFHYKPLWDPGREMYDRRRTAVVMKDWYALKDPRQFYYGAYTIARARQQDAVDRQMEFAEKHELLRRLPEDARQAIAFALLPLRHYEWGANMNLAHVAAYGYGTAITQAAMMATMDRLGMAQHLSRIGLLLDGNSGESLATAKQVWMEEPAWQGLRREVENTFVTRDWFEVFVAQALVADSLVYPLLFQQFDARIAARHGAGLSSVLDFLLRWFDETTRWVDATIKTAAAESADNRTLICGWVAKWRAAFSGALQPLAAAALAESSRAALDTVLEALDARSRKLGAGP